MPMGKGSKWERVKGRNGATSPQDLFFPARPSPDLRSPSPAPASEGRRPSPPKAEREKTRRLPRVRCPPGTVVFAVGFRRGFWHVIAMSAIEVMNEIKALPQTEQERLVRLLVEETDWLEDMMDAAIAKARMDEPERPVEMLLREQGLG